MWIRRVTLACGLLVGVLPLNGFAESPAKPALPSRTLYPYKDLPGVTAPQAFNEKFKCWTRTADIGYGFHRFDRDYPQLVYVCEQNGVISESTRPPNYSYWQYNNRNH